MRAKVFIPCLVSLCLSLAVFMTHRVTIPAQPVSFNEKPVESPARTTASIPLRNSAQLKAPEKESFVSPDIKLERIARLSAQGMSNDAADLTEIFSALTDPDPDVRSAARDAAVQFGSRDAIPWLQWAISQVSDVREKAELQSDIEYLQLPTVAEVTQE